MTSQEDDDDGFHTVYPVQNFIQATSSPDAVPADAADRRYTCQDPDDDMAARSYALGWKDPRSNPALTEENVIRVIESLSPEERRALTVGSLRTRLPDDGFWRAENRRINAEKERIAADILNREFNSRMRAVIKEKRVSKVFKISSWPFNTRDVGWGLLHDQIWFYDEPTPGTEFPGAPHEEHGMLTWPPVQSLDGKWWRRDEGRWLRLYMDRRMLWLPTWVARLRIWNRFRLHRFFSGDDDSAPHDHPWSFWTIPFFRYTETVELSYEDYTKSPLCKLPVDQRHVSWVQSSVQHHYLRVTYRVRRWWPQFRRAEHRHFVHEPERPFRTLVCARETVPARKWGFWPAPTEFVPYDVWTRYEP